MGKKNRRRPKSTGATVRRAAQEGALVPQDHAQKDEADGGLREITYRGHTWTIDPQDLNDYRVIEASANGNLVPAMRALIPSDTVRERLLDDIADDKGRVPLERIGQLVEELAALVGLGK